jgi:putative two-component system response regulator
MKNAFKILILEDDPFTLKAITQKLTSQTNYECSGASTLKKALELVKSETFDIIISDYSLPDGTGLEFFETIKSFTYDIPFVIITASEQKELIQYAINLGVNDFLTKPFHLENLPTIIERNIQRKKFEIKTKSPHKVSVLLKTIQSLITALEAKDSYTSGHSVNVARTARKLGWALHLSEKDLFTLELAALLHDIGKIGMPDSILNKKTSLRDAEYITAKKHTVIGSEIVGKIDELKEVASIIRHHHERYDGSGYPDGLSGEVIPIFARILAIADSYETLISKRIYKSALTGKDALIEIRKNAGSQFDPELVKIFIEYMEKGSDDNLPELEFEKYNGK